METRWARSRRCNAAKLASAPFVACAALLFGAGTTHAYPPPGYAAALAASCVTATHGQQCAVTLTLTQPNGQPASGVEARFTVSGCGSVNPTSGMTDAQGRVDTTFKAGTSCCGAVTITASAPSVGATAETVVNVKCNGSLPATGAAGPSAGIPTPALVILFAALTTMLVGGAVLRTSRRRA